MEYTNEIHDLIIKIAKLKARKIRPGSKIYYAEKRLAELKAAQHVKIERKSLPQKRSPRKKRQTLPSVHVMQNRAYVLSCETHDLLQAMVALEKLRKG